MHDLSFTLRNGELLAIMGGSGTGKTTLLSLLNGTLRPQEGTITINGHDISEPAAKSLIGYVPQDDLLIEELTVYQNLWFTAKLCFEGMSEADLDKRVMKTLKDLGLDATKDLKVGSAINKFISGGQRKLFCRYRKGDQPAEGADPEGKTDHCEYPSAIKRRL